MSTYSNFEAWIAKYMNQFVYARSQATQRMEIGCATRTQIRYQTVGKNVKFEIQASFAWAKPHTARGTDFG